MLYLENVTSVINTSMIIDYLLTDLQELKVLETLKNFIQCPAAKQQVQ